MRFPFPRNSISAVNLNRSWWIPFMRFCFNSSVSAMLCRYIKFAWLKAGAFMEWSTPSLRYFILFHISTRSFKIAKKKFITLLDCAVWISQTSFWGLKRYPEEVYCIFESFDFARVKPHVKRPKLKNARKPFFNSIRNWRAMKYVSVHFFSIYANFRFREFPRETKIA